MINVIEQKINAFKNVDDFSKKNALEIIRKIHEKYSNVPLTAISLAARIVLVYKYELRSEQKEKTLTIVVKENDFCADICDELSGKISFTKNEFAFEDLEEILKNFKG